MKLSIMWPKSMCYQNKPFISLVGHTISNFVRSEGKYFRLFQGRNHLLLWWLSTGKRLRHHNHTIKLWCGDKSTLDSKDCLLSICEVIVVTIVSKYVTLYLVVTGIGMWDCSKAIIVPDDILHCLINLLSCKELAPKRKNLITWHMLWPYWKESCVLYIGGRSLWWFVQSYLITLAELFQNLPQIQYFPVGSALSSWFKDTNLKQPPSEI